MLTLAQWLDDIIIVIIIAFVGSHVEGSLYKDSFHTSSLCMPWR